MCAPLDSYFTEKESFGALILPEPKANDPVVSIETNRLKAQQRRLTNNNKKNNWKIHHIWPVPKSFTTILDRNLSQPVSANLFSNLSA